MNIKENSSASKWFLNLTFAYYFVVFLSIFLFPSFRVTESAKMQAILASVIITPSLLWPWIQHNHKQDEAAGHKTTPRFAALLILSMFFGPLNYFAVIKYPMYFHTKMTGVEKIYDVPVETKLMKEKGTIHVLHNDRLSQFGFTMRISKYEYEQLPHGKMFMVRVSVLESKYGFIFEGFQKLDVAGQPPFVSDVHKMNL